MAETVYNQYKTNLADGSEDWVNGDYRVLLLTGALTIDPDHDFVAGVLAVNTEASDASYARQALATKTNTLDDTNDRANLDAATVDFGALDNETPTAMVVFRQVTTDSDSPVVSIHDTNFGTAANGAGYTVEFPNDVIRISQLLPIKAWRIVYADGSTFTSSDGTWAEAPPFGVQAVVYYHPDGRITQDGGSDDGHVYVWRGEDSHPDYAELKMGLWMDRDGFYRICDLETLSVSPEV